MACTCRALRQHAQVIGNPRRSLPRAGNRTVSVVSLGRLGAARVAKSICRDRACKQRNRVSLTPAAGDNRSLATGRSAGYDHEKKPAGVSSQGSGAAVDSARRPRTGLLAVVEFVPPMGRMRSHEPEAGLPPICLAPGQADAAGNGEHPPVPDEVTAQAVVGLPDRSVRLPARRAVPTDRQAIAPGVIRPAVSCAG
jgi:hypothetical protein